MSSGSFRELWTLSIPFHIIDCDGHPATSQSSISLVVGLARDTNTDRTPTGTGAVNEILIMLKDNSEQKKNSEVS